jgi:hypothetical protein
MRLYTVQANPQDWTGHIALTEGHTVRLMIRIFTASGREITPPENPVVMSFSLSPTTLATANVADSALLLFDLTPTAPANADGGLFIALTEPSTSTTKSFGPFFILVHAP